MNAFSINPNLVVVDHNQESHKLVEKQGLDVTLAALQNIGRIALHWTSTRTERQQYFD